MKIVIDISEELRKDILEDGVIYVDYEPLLRDAIKNGTPLPKEHGWIPVSERQPKESGIYWCTFGGNNFITGKDTYITESDAKEIFAEPEEYTGWNSHNVIAWMPLPKPYQAESEEEQNAGI